MNRLDNKLLIVILSFVGWIVVVSMLGSNIGKSWWGNYFRGDGIITVLHLVGLALLVGMYSSKDWVRRFGQGLAFGGVGVSVVTIVQAMLSMVQWGRLDSVWGGAYGASFGQPNYLAGYLVMTIPWTGFFLLQSRAGWWWLGVVVEFMGLGLTRSWGGTMVLLMLTMIWLMITKNRQKWFMD